MKKIFLILFLLVGLTYGCGGSTPSPKETGPDSDVVSVISTSSGSPPPEGKTEIPEYPAKQEKMKEDRGIIKLYLKAYDPCSAGGCDATEEVETAEDRQRYSVPYQR